MNFDGCLSIKYSHFGCLCSFLCKENVKLGHIYKIQKLIKMPSLGKSTKSFPKSIMQNNHFYIDLSLFYQNSVVNVKPIIYFGCFNDKVNIA